MSKVAGVFQSSIRRYNNLSTANYAANNRDRGSMILLGDDELFWLVSLGDGERLLRAGYELA